MWYLFYSQHHDGGYDRYTYTRQHAESTGSDELIRILESLLECADGK